MSSSIRRHFLGDGSGVLCASLPFSQQATIGADFNAARRYWDVPIPGNPFSG